jgi:hypothetical protein
MAERHWPHWSIVHEAFVGFILVMVLKLEVPSGKAYIQVKSFL